MLKRKRRAAVEDIYRGCKPFNTCPPDVINKVENTTIADKILQWGSTGIFLGGLGIGTGKGTGGSRGYVPLGEGPGVRVGNKPLNRGPYVPVPIDRIGPRDFLPVNPRGPSVIQLEDLPPTVDLPGTDVEVVAEIHPVPDVPSISSGVTTTGDSSAILEISPVQPPERAVTRIQYSNPLFEIRVTSNNNIGETSSTDHIFAVAGGGSTVGEEIPLVSFRQPEFSDTVLEETSFTTSTPKSERPITYKPMTLNKRIAENIEIREPEFLGRARNLVTFDNPAFEDSVSLVFDQDVAEIADELTAPPMSEFRDIIRLSRPLFSQAKPGRVRFSRIGQRATIRTRSGATIGPRVNYYQDLSTIVTEESIELVTLGEQPRDAVVVSGPQETAFEVVDLSEETPLYADDDLLDVYEDMGHSVLSFNRRGQTQIPVPNLQFKAPYKIVPDIDAEVVYHPEGDEKLIPIHPNDIPLVIINIDNTGPDFVLHPSYHRRKRKRRFL